MLHTNIADKFLIVAAVSLIEKFKNTTQLIGFSGRVEVVSGTTTTRLSSTSSKVLAVLVGGLGAVQWGLLNRHLRSGSPVEEKIIDRGQWLGLIRTTITHCGWRCSLAPKMQGKPS